MNRGRNERRDQVKAASFLSMLQPIKTRGAGKRIGDYLLSIGNNGQWQNGIPNGFCRGLNGGLEGKTGIGESGNVGWPGQNNVGPRHRYGQFRLWQRKAEHGAIVRAAGVKGCSI